MQYPFFPVEDYIPNSVMGVEIQGDRLRAHVIPSCRGYEPQFAAGRLIRICQKEVGEWAGISSDHFFQTLQDDVEMYARCSLVLSGNSKEKYRYKRERWRRSFFVIVTLGVGHFYLSPVQKPELQDVLPEPDISGYPVESSDLRLGLGLLEEAGMIRIERRRNVRSGAVTNVIFPTPQLAKSIMRFQEALAA